MSSKLVKSETGPIRLPGRTYVERLPSGKGALVRKREYGQRTGITPMVAACFNSSLWSFSFSKKDKRVNPIVRVLSSPAKLERSETFERSRSAKHSSKGKSSSTSKKSSPWESKMGTKKESRSVRKEAPAAPPPPPSRTDGSGAPQHTYYASPFPTAFSTPYPTPYTYALPPGASPYQVHCPHHAPPYANPYATLYLSQPPTQSPIQQNTQQPIQHPVQQTALQATQYPTQQSAEQPAQQPVQQPVQQPLQESVQRPGTPPAPKVPMTRVVHTVSTDSPGRSRRYRCRGCHSYRSEEYHRRVQAGGSPGRNICRICLESNYSSDDDDDDWRHRHRLGRHGIRRPHYDSGYYGSGHRRSVHVDTDSAYSSDATEEIRVTRRHSVQPTIRRIRSRSFINRRLHSSYGPARERVRVVETSLPKRRRSFVRTRNLSDYDHVDDRYARHRTEVIETASVPRHRRRMTSDFSYDDAPVVETVVTDVRPRHSRRSYVSDETVEVVRPSSRVAHTTVAFEEPSRLRRVRSSRNINDSGRPRGMFRYVDGAGGSSEETRATGPSDPRGTECSNTNSKAALNSSSKTAQSSSFKGADSASFQPIQISSFKATPNTSFRTEPVSSFQTSPEDQTPATSTSSQDRYTTPTTVPKYHQRPEESGTSSSQEYYSGPAYRQHPSEATRYSTHSRRASTVIQPPFVRVAPKKSLDRLAHEQAAAQAFVRPLSRMSSWSTHPSRKPSLTGEGLTFHIGPEKPRETSWNSQERQASQETSADFYQQSSHSGMLPQSNYHLPLDNAQDTSSYSQGQCFSQPPPADYYQARPLSRVSSWSTHLSRKPSLSQGDRVVFTVHVGNPKPSSKNNSRTTSSKPSQEQFLQAPAAPEFDPVEIAKMFEGANIDPGANQARSIFADGKVPCGRPLSEIWAAQKEPDGWDIGWENMPGVQEEDEEDRYNPVPEPHLLRNPFVHSVKGSKGSEELFYYKNV